MVLFIISYANRDADSYKIKNHLGKKVNSNKYHLKILNFQENNFVKKHGFMTIKTADDYWEWAEKTLLSELKVLYF